MQKITRFVKNVLVLGFVLVLGLSYYELADRVAPVVLTKAPDGSTLMSTTASTYFYASAGFVVLTNILFSIMAKSVANMPLHHLPISNADFWRQDEEHKERLKDVFMTWIYGFPLILNAFMTLLIAKIWFVNRQIGGQVYEYGLLTVGLLLVLFLWIGFLFYRLRIRREEYIT